MKNLLFLLTLSLFTLAGWSMIVQPSSEAKNGVSEVRKAISIRYLTLKEGVSAEEFERFMTTEYLPMTAATFHVGRGTFIKGDRGKNVNGYVWHLEFNSVEARDWYFTEGNAGNWYDAYDACSECQTIQDRLGSMIVEDLYQDYTDYVEMK